MSTTEQVHEVAVRARQASHELALATRATKDSALLAMARSLMDQAIPILKANAEDIARAEEGGTGNLHVPIARPCWPGGPDW